MSFNKLYSHTHFIHLFVQLLKLYAMEDEMVVSMVTESGVTNEAVSTFLKELKELSTSYAKVQ